MRKFAYFVLVLAFTASSVAAGQTVPGAGPVKKNSVRDPVLKVKNEYYKVCGCSDKDIQCDLKVKSIKCDDGKKYDSVTNWKMTWNYGTSKSASGCFTDAFTVTVDVVFRLPKWARDVKAPQQLADRWDAYVKNILVHEGGHRDRAMIAAVELTQAVAALPPARTCSQLGREVNKIAHARINRLYEEQAAYDEATDHGRSQGVRFP